MTPGADPLRILVSTPVYWPAVSFGGPMTVFRELVGGLAGRGHDVDVYTSSIESLEERPPTRTAVREVDGACVTYVGTPLRFRWMGLTPQLPLLLRRRARRPNVAHVFGYRDPVGALTAAWCRRNGVPYVFEAMGMFEPKLRKVALKRLLDRAAFVRVAAGAGRIVATSELERREYLVAGMEPVRVVVRPNGFPPQTPPADRPGRLRRRLGLSADAPLVFSAGRLARGKGFDVVVRAAAQLPQAHVALAGPDAGHGVLAELEVLRRELGLDDRVHFLGALAADELTACYADADVFVLASAYENFGMVAAEAAAAGTPVVISHRCGVAELLRDGGLVVPPEDTAVAAAVARLLSEPDLRQQLAAGAAAAARAWSWSEIVDRQERLYREIAAR